MISYSILIITYNQKRILDKALRSLARQIRNPKMFEIVIADDCSADGTDEYIKTLRYPIFLKYIRLKKNSGRSIIRNSGFEKTTSENVIFLDGDMVPAPGMVDSYLESWEKYPGSVIVGSWRNPTEWQGDRLAKYLSSRGRFRRGSEGPIPGKYFNSGNFSIKREIFARQSGFDLAFEGWKGEDTDFGLRLEKESVPIYYKPEALCYHYHKKSLKEMEGEFERFGRTSYRVLLGKHPASSIFKNGWILGLPDSESGLFKKTAGAVLSPLRSDPAIAMLEFLAAKREGGLLPNFCYTWLLYSYLARGFRKSMK